jgi:hypothetical protein
MDVMAISDRFKEAAFPLKRGCRPQTPGVEEIQTEMDDYYATMRLAVGYKRLAKIAARRTEPPTPYGALHHLMYPTPTHSQEKKELHDKADHAKFRDVIWHPDSHKLFPAPDGHGGRSVISVITFMDDATGLITGCELLTDKHAQTRGNVLRHI